MAHEQVAIETADSQNRVHGADRVNRLRAKRLRPILQGPAADPWQAPLDERPDDRPRDLHGPVAVSQLGAWP